MTAPVRPFDEASRAAPYEVYGKLREQAPVHRVTLPDGLAAWLVTRDGDVRAGLADPRLSVDKAHSGTGYRGFSLPPALDASLYLRLAMPPHELTWDTSFRSHAVEAPSP